jgi:predicted nucleotide-binding protein
VDLDAPFAWEGWASRVTKFLEKALGSEVAYEFKQLQTADPRNTFEMQRGHIEGLLAMEDDLGPGPSAIKALIMAAGTGDTKTTRKVFVVHGHDGEAKEMVARFLEKLGLQPIILHEQPNEGRTVIEKFEISSSDVAFAVVLLTPDDLGSPNIGDADRHPRARQNVILELGYFMGRLGRSRVCALYKPGVELPSDFQGVVYVEFDPAGGWRAKLAQEFVTAKLVINVEALVRM